MAGKNDYQKSKQLANVLIQHSQQIALSSGLPILVINEQKGNTFGERLHHAFEEGFAKGYDQILAIGNDTPDLKVEDLWKAQHSLLQSSIILGPSTDGGVYLIGLNKTVFEQLNFTQLPWQTPNLFNALVNAANQQDISIELLPVLSDIDNVEDLKNFLQTQDDNAILKQRIIDILYVYTHPIYHFFLPFFRYFFWCLYQRPPPVVQSNSLCCIIPVFIPFK